MISITGEQLILVSDVPRLLPPHRGKRVHRATVQRWIGRGRGGCRLETIKIGGQRYTSIEALQRFATACTAIATPTAPPPTVALDRRQHQIDDAAARVAKILNSSPAGVDAAPGLG